MIARYNIGIIEIIFHLEKGLRSRPAFLGGTFVFRKVRYLFIMQSSSDIPVNFDYLGSEFSGYLSKVSGAGTNGMYHLMINGYYRGQLFKTANGWRFGSNDGMFEEQYMVDYFASVVEANNS
jgi:hypothetical protein